MFSIAIHGGAGTISRNMMDATKEASYLKGLQDALDAGYAVLEQGGTAIDGVTAAVVALEDCILFNAGRGSVFNHVGKHEMDASVMRGDNLDAGAVAAVSNIKNPVQLAKMIMEHTEHVMLVGEGAEALGKKLNIQFEPDTYFYSEQRYEQLQQALREDRVQLDHTENNEKKFGTVGAVALDSHGNLAAATSTGGMTNKKYGRVGDTPIIGAGTYANNATCAVSCTGHGELFIRQVVAHQVHCLMLYKGLDLQAACDEVVKKDLVKIEGEGGLVAVNKDGTVCMSFNSEGMYRGMKNSKGEQLVAIYKDE